MAETFTVKLYKDSISGGGTIYIKKEHFELLIEMLGFPLKKELKAEINPEDKTLCITKL